MLYIWTVRSKFIFDVVHPTIFPIKQISILVNIIVFHRELFISGFCTPFFQSRPKGEGRGRVSHLGTGDVAVQLKWRTIEVKLVYISNVTVMHVTAPSPSKNTDASGEWVRAGHS